MTRSTYLLLAFTIIMSQSVSAQFFAGFSGGMNLATTSFTGDLDFPGSKSSTFAFGGVHSGYKLHDKWTFISDLQFSQKGYWIDYADFIDPVPNTYARYSYLDLVPQMEYSINKYVSIGAGIYVSKLLQEAYKSTGSNWVAPANDRFISSMDAGPVASVKLKFEDFFIFGRYQHGIVNIQNGEFTDVNGMAIDVTQRNMVYQFGVGYVFFRPKKMS